MFNLPKNIYIMSLVSSLCLATSSLMVLISGLLGRSLAPDASLATLPMASFIISTALATVPAAMIMRKLGRKKGFLVGISIAIGGALCALLATLQANFWLLIAATLCFGFNMAFTQQGRFIIIENADNPKQQADGLILALLASLLGGFIGPQFGSLGKDLIASPHGYAGSFLLLAMLLTVAFLIMCTYKEKAFAEATRLSTERSLFDIVKQPAFIIAAGTAATGYAVMSLVMTATPLSMVEMNGLSLQHATFVIQSHIVAMFLPSIVTGKLLKMGLHFSLIIAGLMCYLVVIIVAFSGHQVMHFWWALVLLGLGWNLLFMASTAMLPETYHANERFKAQAFNEFSVFTAQAIAAFSAGWILFNYRWNGVLHTALGISVFWIIALIVLSWLERRSVQTNPYVPNTD
ncbi:MAG: MFS transporter [Pseudomonadales bacterium]|nr:MFS transporter [Pseudomonadales bacterium]